MISSGANPKDIKGKSNKLLLNGSVYGSVQGSSFSLNVQNSIQVSSDSHVDVDPVDSTRCGPERVNKGSGYGGWKCPVSTACSAHLFMSAE